ncbi:MAG: peptide chain release factor N(5)-glutamine methyltransferase [Bacillota bacterium]|nr:peptide chain release factor N(5)-glutamine methyltransferase [Bacillota bacterium]
MKTRILIREGQYQLNKAGCPDPKTDAEELYSFLTGRDRVQIFLRAEEEDDPETERRYLKLIERRAQRIPLQHIIGEQEFMGYRFAVSADVLIPRQDTEILVQEGAKAIQSTQKQKRSFFERLRGRKDWEVLDLCCGSGVVGISVARICGSVELTASDISEAAVALTKRNARDNHVDAEVLQGDLFTPLRGRRFDMILCNPPYVRTNMIGMLQDEIKDYEPREALDGGRDGLVVYRRIVAGAPDYLKENGFLMMEIGYDQGEALRKMLKDDGRYREIEIVRDLPGKERVIRCRLKRGRQPK